PEMNYKTGAPEPFAKKAKQFLKEKVLRKKVGLRYGPDKKDHYGRLLAHVFYDKLNLQQALLSEGLAVNITIPPNLWQQNCYLSAEKSARQNKRGLWKNHLNNIVDAQAIKPGQTGFQFVKGRVKEIRLYNKTTWLKLSNKLSLRISAKNMGYFNAIDIKQLKGKTVIARGWVHLFKNRFRMTINHPNSLEIL
ncbi:MAG TPA: hypothetical protein ENK06_03630, partial [Gammaproteobacteria bacterium]|nr:hypothetical protein [Gammaproteobacteria bacterium]